MMLITDPEQLKAYRPEKRIWQGIPSIEVTDKGRIFLAFYSGAVNELPGNYVLLLKSDDAVDYGMPVAAAYLDAQHRCFDPALWIDPLGRLWLTWAIQPDDAVYGVICDDPDAPSLTWSEPFFIGHNVMMNKPTVLSSGEWLFPIGVWHHSIRRVPEGQHEGSYAYVSYDNGKTIRPLGYADVANRSFDEHMILEMRDGTLRMFVRTNYGIGAADSYDRGRTWGKCFDTGYGGPSSRFFIRRLQSGRILLINHVDFQGRNNLTALLSDDDGKTFPHRLLLDNRSDVSYPDAKQTPDGSIYITYDRERGNGTGSIAASEQKAREILVAKITEDDILAGKITGSDSFLKRVACKLGKYHGDDPNPYAEPDRFTDEEYAAYIRSHTTAERVIAAIFAAYPVNCSNLHNIDAKRLDDLIRTYQADPEDPLRILCEIITLVRSASSVQTKNETDILRQICGFIAEHLNESFTVEEIAETLNYSCNYLQHIFKQRTGSTIGHYRNEQRLTNARLLLIDNKIRILDVASACGFDSPSYFSKLFKREFGLSPEQYRELHHV